MASAIITRLLITWLLFLPLAILNGIAREKIYRTNVGDLASHQISTAIAVVAYFALAYFLWRNVATGLSTPALFAVGGIWVLMTICFEFGFGHYVDGRSWEWLFQDYNIFKGRLWGLFLLFIFLSPYLVKLFDGFVRNR